MERDPLPDTIVTARLLFRPWTLDDTTHPAWAIVLDGTVIGGVNLGVLRGEWREP